MNRTDLQQLSNARIRAAKILFAAAEYSGAYYLAGYAVECALKACIAKDTQQHDFPDRERAQKSYSHRPIDLMRVADLYNEFQAAMLSDPILATNWTVVSKWTEQSRYEFWTAVDADGLLNAVIREPDGVLPWIKRHW